MIDALVAEDEAERLAGLETGVKPIARALADAARQLSETSDTARLDAELLMAEALHIDRDN